LAFYTRYFVVWVVLCGVVAYFWPSIWSACWRPAPSWPQSWRQWHPDPFLFFKPYNTLFFSLTMFGIGAVLKAEDFKRILERPVIVLIGSIAQFTIMPLGAFAVARLLGLNDALTAGLILAGSAPGAMASNVMSYLAKADTAYSVSLTTVSTLLCPILTPGLTYLLTQGTELDVSFLKLTADVMVMVVIPLLAGFGVRHVFREKLERIEPVFPALSTTFIVFICALVIALNRERLAHVTGVVLTAALILNAYGLAAGYGVGSLFGMGAKRRRTLTIEIGMQNAGLGATLALNNLGDEAAIPAAIFVFVCIFTASGLASLWQRTPTDPQL
jgi:BASS family bile acid:Na+ symporter